MHAFKFPQCQRDKHNLHWASCKWNTLGDTVTFSGSMKSQLRHLQFILSILHIWQFGNFKIWSSLSLQFFENLKSIFLCQCASALISMWVSAYIVLRSTCASSNSLIWTQFKRKHHLCCLGHAKSAPRIRCRWRLAHFFRIFRLESQASVVLWIFKYLAHLAIRIRVLGKNDKQIGNDMQ